MATERPSVRHDQSGYTLIELMVSVTILMIVSAVALEGVFRLTRTSATIANRTSMHSGVRNATELLQQEVGQAGRVALPNLVRLTSGAAAGSTTAVSVQAVDSAGNALAGQSGVAGMFVGERLVVGTGANEETVTLTAVNTGSNQFTARFVNGHTSGEPVAVYGGFSWGVIPTSIANGSTGTSLKIFGDIHADNTLDYVEYTCDLTAGNLYRRTVAWDATTKPALAVEQALLNNVRANPDGTPCFTYQQRMVANVPYVVDVAITLTVEPPERDQQTGLFQRETKALLNVAPRNVFNVWQLASLGISNRLQPLPANILTLMAQP